LKIFLASSCCKSSIDYLSFAFNTVSTIPQDDVKKCFFYARSLALTGVSQKKKTFFILDSSNKIAGTDFTGDLFDFLTGVVLIKRSKV